MALPEPIAVELTRIASQIEPDPDASRTAAAIIRHTRDWVRNNHDYELGVPTDTDGPDPVLQFFAAKRGHCEYFATATALLLRAQGVPTRYVTGFVCMESHPSEGVWIARFGDCHAWVEAYDSAADQWVLVESTPAAGLPDSLSRTPPTQVFLERLRTLWATFYAKVKRGYVAEAVLGLISDAGRLLSWLYLGAPAPITWALTVILLVAVVWWLRRYGATRAAIATDPRQELRRSQRRLDALLRRYQIQRLPATSIRELVAQVRQRQPPLAEELVAMLLHYERLRYTPTPPSLDDVAGFDERLADVSRRSAATATAAAGT